MFAQRSTSTCTSLSQYTARASRLCIECGVECMSENQFLAKSALGSLDDIALLLSTCHVSSSSGFVSWHDPLELLLANVKLVCGITVGRQHCRSFPRHFDYVELQMNE
jgi:hypothetical protein